MQNYTGMATISNYVIDTSVIFACYFDFYCALCFVGVNLPIVKLSPHHPNEVKGASIDNCTVLNVSWVRRDCVKLLISLVCMFYTIYVWKDVTTMHTVLKEKKILGMSL